MVWLLELLTLSQVFDLSEESPDKVLHRLYANFEKLKSNGDNLADEIQKKLRLIVSVLPLVSIYKRMHFLPGCFFVLTMELSNRLLVVMARQVGCLE